MQTHATPRPTVIADEDDARKDSPCLEVLLVGDVLEEREHGYGSSGFPTVCRRSAVQVMSQSSVVELL